MQLGFQIQTRAGRGENLILTVKLMSKEFCKPLALLRWGSALALRSPPKKSLCHGVIPLPDLLSEGLSQEQGGKVPSLQSHSSTRKKPVIKGIM